MKEDFNTLRLKHHGDLVAMDEILQRECRYKATTKLYKTLKYNNFRFPSLAVTEMSTSDDVAEIHGSLITENATVLDMTCGLGIDTFHFSKKAAHVTSVELDENTFQCARHNISALGIENIDIVRDDSIEFLRRSKGHFDFIFVDPARRNISGRHFALKDCTPDIIPSLDLILSHCDTLIIKASPMIDIAATAKEICHDCQVYVIGTVKECKEVVFVVSSSTPKTDIPNVTCITAITVGHTSLSFVPKENSSSSMSFGIPSLGDFLYEPYPSVMKSGGVRFISEKYGVDKLAPNTHLYTSHQKLNSFPGEVFLVENTFPFSKQSIRTILTEYPMANIATRNFPLTAPQLAQKLKIKEGGNKMLFGVTTHNKSRLLLITSMGKAL